MPRAATLLPLLLPAAAAGKPHILHLVIDDLGYTDLGYKNGIVESPQLDALAQGGVKLTDYYTFTVCAPSRASIMTGRYPWAIGYYWVGGDMEGVDLRYQMLPKLLKTGGYETVAIGKWHVGAILQAQTPTFRGFDEFFGYYHAATGSYWYHTGEGGGCKETSAGALVVDFSNNTGSTVLGATGLNGTYSTHAFTDYAVARINAHDASTPLYMYLAQQATHDAAGSGIQAPLGTVERYPLVPDDTFKVQAAAITELDWSVGNVTNALKAKGMWATTVVVVVSDNGGPLGHTINYPLRGGKHTYWEGGIRGEAFVYSELLPQGVRGTEWPGLCHTSDWYPTFVQGVAGLSVPSDTGPNPVDGFDLWPALQSGGTSPRSEVVSQVQNEYSKGHGAQAGVIRSGDYKLIISNPGDDRMPRWPANAKSPVAFGGEVEKGTDHATAKGADIPGTENKTKCAASPCLFDVRKDPGESDDLAADPAHADLVATLTQRLQTEAARGPPFAETFNDSKKNQQAKEAMCDIATTYGFTEPSDCATCPHPPPAPPTPAPPPAPPPADCEAACEKACPHKDYPTYDACLTCTRDTSSVTAVCKPKERQAYCNETQGPLINNNL